MPSSLPDSLPNSLPGSVAAANLYAAPVPVSVNAEPAPIQMHLADLIAIIRRRRTLILGVATMVIAVVLVALIVWPTRYVASASVVLEGRKNAVADASSVLSALPTDPASLQNQIQILTSRDLAGAVVDRLHLDKDPEFAPSPGFFSSLFSANATPAQRRNLTVDSFLRNLSVDAVGLSTTIDVSFASRDPDKAAAIANALADAYAASQVTAKVEAAESATRWFTVRIGQLAVQARNADVAVQRYKAQHNLADGPDGTPLIDQQILAISTQLVQARADLSQRQGESGRGAGASQVAASPLIVQLRQQEAQLIQQQADMATRYGPRHPKMQQIISQRRDLQAKIAEETRRATGGMRNDTAAAAAQVASLEASLAHTQRQAAAESMTRIELKALEANAQSTRTMYDSFVTRLRETQDQEAMQMPDARVVSRASPPTSPASPKRTLIFAASIPAGLLLGLLVALFAERFGSAMPTTLARPNIARALSTHRAAPPPVVSASVPQSVTSPAPESVPTRPGLPVLAEFPDLIKMSSSAQPPADYVLDHPTSGFARAIAALDRQIATKNWQAPKVLVITGADPGSSKTTIALSLARAASQRGQRVILVDGDPKEPAAGAMMRLPAPSGGIAEVVTGLAPLSKSVARDPRSNVMLLSWVRKPLKVRELIASRRMHDLMSYLRDKSDLIIVDAPPIHATEGTAYIPYADAVLVVASANTRAQPAAMRTLGVLATIGAPTIGVALVS